MQGSQSVSERVLALLDGAFEKLATADVPLSEAIAQATRIARLRNDFENLQWLEMEQRTLDSKPAWEEVFDEFAGHFSAGDLQQQRTVLTRRYLAERTTEVPDGLDSDKSKEITFARSVRDIEANMGTVAEMTEVGELPAGMGVQAFNEKQKVAVFAARTKKASTEVLNRIERRVRAFLGETEKQVMFGQINADIFERNRRFVDEQLASIAPKALEQILSAYRRAEEGSAEGRSQALLSCRRALKSMADLLCPPTAEAAVGEEGEQHALTEDKWLNRLVEFVKVEVPKSTSGELVQTQIEELARRFRGLGEASSRGVHADVSEFELNQAVIQTYLTIGDLLRIRADDSGLAVAGQGLGGAST